MRRAKTIKYAAAAVFLALCLLLCGCASIGELLSAMNAEETESAAPVNKTEAAPTAAADNAGINPVFSLYSEFTAAYRAASEGMLDAVASLGSAEAASLYTELLCCEAALVRALWAVGMLPQSETGGGFSGSVTGTENGEGRLHTNGDFTFAFESGEELSGSYPDGGVFTCTSSGAERVRLKLAKRGGGFRMSVVIGRNAFAAEISKDGIRCADTPLSFDIENDAFPEDALTLTYSDAGAQIAE